MTDSFGAGNEAPVERTGGEERIEADSRERALQKKWLARLSAEEKAHKGFRDRGKQVSEIYENNLQHEVIYVPTYWSVMKIQKSGIYSAQPTPDVRPRNESRDPVFLAVSTALERGIAYTADQKDFDDNFGRSVWDYLGVSMGVCRVKVDSVINTTEHSVPLFQTDPVTGQAVQVGVETQVEESIGDQYLRWEYVPWARFGWEPGNHWRSVSWIYFRHRMSRKEMKERFGRVVKASKDERDRGDNEDWKRKTCDIFEVWDKDTRTVMFIAKGETEPLEVHDDPLGLIDFFPCPTPMTNNVPSEELNPVPDYDYIEQFDIELNRLQERRKQLLEQIKAAGFYDASIGNELSEALEAEDGQFKPVQNLISRMSTAGGVDKAVSYLPILEKAQVLEIINNNITFVSGQVEAVLGISDIQRGITQQYETAQAQEIKGSWVGVRLSDKRATVQYTVREVFRITAQLLASHITPENLQRMTQMPLTEEMMALMQDDLMMDFAIEVETDSTIAKDENAEMATRQEMLNTVAQYVQAPTEKLPADVSSAILASALKPHAKHDRALMESMASLPDTMSQLQGMQQQIGEKDQQIEQLTAEAQNWQNIAQTLQMAATEAKAKDLEAAARKKEAERGKILEETFTEHEKHGAHPKVGIPTDDMASADLGRYEAETARISAEKSNGQGLND